MLIGWGRIDNSWGAQTGVLLEGSHGPQDSALATMLGHAHEDYSMQVLVASRTFSGTIIRMHRVGAGRVGGWTVGVAAGFWTVHSSRVVGSSSPSS